MPELLQLIEKRERLLLSSLVLYEWRRGPRTDDELAAQETVLPSSAAVPFDFEAANLAAKLYKNVRGARNREVDLAIAACAIRHDAKLWTLNSKDFAGIPGLVLLRSTLSR